MGRFNEEPGSASARKSSPPRLTGRAFRNPKHPFGFQSKSLPNEALCRHFQVGMELAFAVDCRLVGA